MLIIDCHKRHVGPFGPSTNVVCQLRPGSLCICLRLLPKKKKRNRTVYSFVLGLVFGQRGNFICAYPLVGHVKTSFLPVPLYCRARFSHLLTLFVSLGSNSTICSYILSALFTFFIFFSISFSLSLDHRAPSQAQPLEAFPTLPGTTQSA